jgi:hypothetical protein
MQPRKGLEIASSHQAVLDTGSRQHAFGDRLARDSRQHRSPVIQSELSQRHDGDRE